MKPLAILFDLDGTLVDTAPDLIAALNALLAELGREPIAPQHLRHEASNGARGLLRAGLNLQPGDAEYEQQRARYLTLYADCLADLSRPFAGVEPMLQALDERAIAWGVVTNKPDTLARPLLAALNLRPATLIGGQGVTRIKPAPDALLLASAHLRVPAAGCWYVGDALRDQQAARSAGMRAIVARYGYIHADEALQDWPADHFIDAPGELLELLEAA